MKPAIRLLEPAPPGAANRTSIDLLGRRWMVRTHDAPPTVDDQPAYTCVSYAWGERRLSHPFEQAESMSDRTVPVLEAALRARPTEALWIDVFCVPQGDPERTACLRNLGAIYARAPVVVVLSAACAPMLDHIRRLDQIEEADLLAFESDPWVTRPWTYQEVVNSGAMSFVAEGSEAPSVQGADVMRCAMGALSEFRKSRGYDVFDLRVHHPRLDAMEDVLADWMAADYLERSAYRTLSDNARRVTVQDGDRCFALMGALTSAPIDPSSDAQLSPEEQFLRLCEGRGDFSFVYTTAVRSDAPGRSWRPAAGSDLRAILPWHTAADRQHGTPFATHLRLEGLHLLEPGPVDPAALEYIREWHDRGRKRCGSGPVSDVVLGCLRDGGFTGCGAVLEFLSGYFFPQRLDDDLVGLEVLISTTLRFVHGAPGLLIEAGPAGVRRCCGVGVFVGRVPKAGASFDIG